METIMKGLAVKNGEKFLFIGDSITDAGRRAADRPYGTGYMSLFMDLQRAYFPERLIDYTNMGIGGDTVSGLRVRWHDDVIAHQPDWLSVKIGINDLHQWLLNGNEEHSPEKFREDYDAILAEAKAKTKAKLILIDPFLITTDRRGSGRRADALRMLPTYIKIVHGLADKYKTRLVRTQDVFKKQLKYVDAGTLCPEPVHPFRKGHVCIAAEVMKVLCK
jgi:lysophospholipase L1-like esterase